MKKILIAVVFVAIASLLTFYALPKIQQNRALSGGRAIKVLLVYNPEYAKSKICPRKTKTQKKQRHYAKKCRI